MTGARTRSLIASALLALLQACATPQPASPEPVPQTAGAEPTPAQPAVAAPAPSAPPSSPPAVAVFKPTEPSPAKPQAPKPAPGKPQPVKPAAPKLLDAMTLPPFHGTRETVVEPLRGVKTIDRTVAPDDLWQRIRQGFAMPNLDNALVRKKTEEYAERPDYLQRMFDRSRIYLYHIVDEIERRGLPTELALLPMVESAFNPLAYSRAHASGLWQFIPGTGRRFDLKQNWWYDGRRDIVDSTNAALDYLTKLYEMHGDWHLALASYNWGENAVARAIARNRRLHKPTDYSSLRMPRETRYYVPKLQALKNIISNPAQYGINLDPIPNQPYFAVVDAPAAMDVALAAKLAEMPVDEFVALNPGFSRPLIRSEAPRIVLPADKVEVFQDNLAKQDPDSLVSWQVYRPKRGERLGTIAKKFHLSIAELKRVNGIPARSWRVPNVLVVPMDAEARDEARGLPIMFSPPASSRGGTLVHVVRRGETLSSIARHFHVRVADLKRWNRLGSVLRAGQKLYIRRR